MPTNYNSLAGRYIRYKDGTEKLITWLAKTASECCDVTTLISSLTKGANAESAEHGGVVEVRVAELLPLAEAIVNSQRDVTIPASILETARAVVGERQKCADTYAAASISQTGDISEKDRSHQFFIGVLEEVLCTLQTVNSSTIFFEPKRSAKPNLKQKQKQTSSIEVAANQFAGLEIQEPADSLAVSAIPAPRIDFSKAKFTVDKAFNSTAFAIWCHLEDMADFRHLVIDIWSKYISGEVSFDLASMVTDVAIRLLKCADDTFVALSPWLAAHDDVVASWELKILHSGGKGDPAIVQESPLAVFFSSFCRFTGPQHQG